MTSALSFQKSFPALILFLCLAHPVLSVELIPDPPPKTNKGIMAVRFSLLAAMDSIAQVSASFRLLRPADISAGIFKSDFQSGFFLKSGYAIPWDKISADRSMTREILVLAGYRQLRATPKLINSFTGQLYDVPRKRKGVTVEIALEAIEWLNDNIGIGIYLSLGFNYWLKDKSGDRTQPLLDLSFGLAF